MKNDIDPIDVENVEPREQELLAQAAYSMAAHMLWYDGLIVIGAALVIACPGLFRVIVDSNNQTLTALSSLISEGLRLAFLFFLATRFFENKWTEPEKLPWERIRALLTYGAILWCIGMIPYVVPFAGALAQSIVSLLCFLVTLMLMFYFVPVCRGTTNPAEVLEEAGEFVSFDPIMPIRVLLMPFALTFFLSTLFSEPFPGTTSHFFSELFYGLGATLSAYLAVAFGIGFTKIKEPSLPVSIPCRPTSNQMPEWIPECFQINNGIICSLLALIVWTNNIHTLYTLPKTTKVEIARVAHSENRLMLVLDVHDREFAYTRFHPMLFSLASEKRTPLAQYPVSMTVNGETLDPNQAVSSIIDRTEKNAPVRIAVEFDVKSRAKDIQLLDDLYLWYAAEARVAKVRLNKSDERPSLLEDDKPMQYAQLGSPRIPKS